MIGLISVDFELKVFNLHLFEQILVIHTFAKRTSIKSIDAGCLFYQFGLKHKTNWTSCFKLYCTISSHPIGWSTIKKNRKLVA